MLAVLACILALLQPAPPPPACGAGEALHAGRCVAVAVCAAGEARDDAGRCAAVFVVYAPLVGG